MYTLRHTEIVLTLPIHYLTHSNNLHDRSSYNFFLSQLYVFACIFSYFVMNYLLFHIAIEKYLVTFKRYVTEK